MNLLLLSHQTLDSILRLLDFYSLLQVRATNKHLRLFASESALWMQTTITSLEDEIPLDWRGDWYSTIITMKNKKAKLYQPECLVTPLGGFQSEFLYRRWYRSNMDLAQFYPQHRPGIEQLDGQMVSRTEFLGRFDQPRLPVLITNLQEFNAVCEWDLNRLEESYGNNLFSMGSVFGKEINMRLNNYLRYAVEQRDEDPLYLFDSNFDSKAPALFSSYTVPSIFPQDLLATLGKNSDRPNYRWMLVGPVRSGSSWHIDPWCSSAWNLLISGKKRWALYPPGRIPPGVKFTVNSDPEFHDLHCDSCTPLQWFLEIYPQLKEEEKPVIEFVQHPGETVFIPCGWWHCVLNLDLTFSITQNFVSESNLPDAVQILSQGAGAYYPQHYPIQGKRKEPPRIPMLGTNWIGYWMKSIWKKYQGLREVLYSLGNFFVYLKGLSKSLEEICAKHAMPSPSKEDCFPYFATSNFLIKTQDSLIKLYIHSNPLNVCIQQSAEMEALNWIQTLPSDKRSGFPSIKAQGIVQFQDHDIRMEIPYIICRFSDGFPLLQVIPGLSTEEKSCIAGRLGSLVGTFHSLSNTRSPIRSQECNQSLELEGLGKLMDWTRKKICEKGLAFFQAQDPNLIWSSNLDSTISYQMKKSQNHEDSSLYRLSISQLQLVHQFNSWTPFVAFLKWRKSVVMKKVDLEIIPRHLVNQLEDYLPSEVEELIPSASSYQEFDPVFLHGDLTIDNILVSQDSKDLNTKGSTLAKSPVSIVDFADFSLGDPLYDFLSIYLSTLQSNRTSMECFLSSYRDVCLQSQSSTLLKKVWTAPRRFVLSYCAMCYSILHEDNVLLWLFTNHPHLKKQQTWNAIEQAVWDILNPWIQDFDI